MTVKQELLEIVGQAVLAHAQATSRLLVELTSDPVDLAKSNAARVSEVQLKRAAQRAWDEYTAAEISGESKESIPQDHQSPEQRNHLQRNPSNGQI